MHKVICINTPVGKYYVELEDDTNLESEIKKFYSGKVGSMWSIDIRTNKYVCFSAKILSDSVIEIFEIDDLSMLR